MKKEQFIRELEYLLQDIPDDEKEDAIQYYRDYLEEAGPENEEAVMLEFGSPERVAAIIRSDLAGGMENGGEFTESGFQDERFREPHYQVAKRMELPEETFEEQKDSDRTKRTGRKLGDHRWIKIVLLIWLLVLAVPVVASVGSGALAVMITLAALFLCVGVVAFVLLLAGVVLIVVGIVQMGFSIPAGVMLLGGAVLSIGIGLIALALSFLFYGRLLPWIFCKCMDLINGLFHRRKGDAR